MQRDRSRWSLKPKVRCRGVVRDTLDAELCANPGSDRTTVARKECEIGINHHSGPVWTLPKVELEIPSAGGKQFA